MKKKILALLCALALLVSAVPGALALNGDRQRSADVLQTLGLVREGDGRSGMSLNAYASRAEAVTLLVRLSGGEEDAKTERWVAGFLDLPDSLEYIVNYAGHRGWVTGYTPVRFEPDYAVSANGWCAFLLRMLGYSDKTGDFTVEGAAQFARHIGLVTTDYKGLLDRGDLLDIAQDALSFHYRDSEDTILSRLIDSGVVSRSTANALGLLSQEQTARQIADHCSAAVFQMDFYANEKSIKEKDPDSNATGFFIDPSGIAVTNYHSLEGSIYGIATLITGEQYEVERVLYYDVDIDIAVCQVSATELTSRQETSAFAALELAGSDELRMGDKVYSIGNPLGLGLSVSEGVVSDPRRVVKGYQLPCIMDTADISQGSSGGALLNVYGQVVGITCGAYTYGNSMYLAVPADPAMTADLTVEDWSLKEVRDIEWEKLTGED